MPMKENSAFFTDDRFPGSGSEPVLCGQGEWSLLYRTDAFGRFRLVKALKQEYRGDPFYENLLRKEFEISYPLAHPHIREVYGFHRNEAFGNYIEMEWIDGRSLADMMKEPSGVKRKDARRIVLQICDALSYIHSRQIVHRDIKLSNILVSWSGCNPRLIDFGMADSESFSMLKIPAGTESFASPELLSGGKVDQRSDLYSLGKIIGLILPSCRFIASKCTRTSPSRRYRDAESLKNALKRRPVTLALASVLSVLLVISAASLWFGRAAEAEPSVPQTNEEVVLSDPSAIDALFHEATDLIEGE